MNLQIPKRRLENFGFLLLYWCYANGNKKGLCNKCNSNGIGERNAVPPYLSPTPALTLAVLVKISMGVKNAEVALFDGNKAHLNIFNN
jgi:hypothetical protein